MSPPDKENPKKAEIHSSKFIPLNSFLLIHSSKFQRNEIKYSYVVRPLGKEYPLDTVRMNNSSKFLRSRKILQI